MFNGQLPAQPCCRVVCQDPCYQVWRPDPERGGVCPDSNRNLSGLRAGLRKIRLGPCPDWDLAIVPWPIVKNTVYQLCKHCGTIHLLFFVLTKCFLNTFRPSGHVFEFQEIIFRDFNQLGLIRLHRGTEAQEEMHRGQQRELPRLQLSSSRWNVREPPKVTVFKDLDANVRQRRDVW